MAVLDTIHGAETIAERMREGGVDATALEVYHSSPKVAPFDLIVAPVHLSPRNPAMEEAIRLGKRVITHHRAVGELLASRRDYRAFEVTGTVGKTTTSLILSRILSFGGVAVSHTTRGIEVWKDGESLLLRPGLSIAPANVIPASDAAIEERADYLVSEISLGGTGLADFAVLTSFARDYKVAAGALWASTAKLQMVSLSRAGSKLIADEDVKISADVTFGSGPRSQVSSTDRMIRAFGCEAPLSLGDGLDLESYAPAISGAAGAALAAGVDLPEIASALEGFEGLGGRMKETRKDGVLLLDNSNSGLRASGVEAALRRAGRGGKLALVVGEEAETVCEGMDIPELMEILSRYREEIDLLILVGERLKPSAPRLSARHSPDLDSGLAEAKAALEGGGRIISCVKCFR